MIPHTCKGGWRTQLCHISNLDLFLFFLHLLTLELEREKQEGCELEEVKVTYADSGARLQVQFLSPVTYCPPLVPPTSCLP